MKRIYGIALILLCYSSVFAHPGKTDYQDGHTCLKNCGEWDLGYDEYHLHDRDRNPIRLDSNRKPVRERMPREMAVSLQEPLPTPPAPERTIPVDPPEKATLQTSGQGRGMAVLEEGVFQLRDMVLIIVAVLLVLVLHMLRRRKQAEK
jgi:hypothetical protein